MPKTFLLSIIIISSIVQVINSQSKCQLYLAKLSSLMIINPHRFQSQIAPYLLFSGKAIDDLGYPSSCQRDQNNYQYNTVQISFVQESQHFFGYMGFCFVKYCSADQLTKGAGFIINYILDDYDTKVKSIFVDPDLDLQFSLSALIVCLLFCIPLGFGIYTPLKKWVQLCKTSEDEQFIIKSTYIDLENPNQELQEQTVDKYSPFLTKISLAHKCNNLFKPQNSFFIYGFSLIRIICVPFLINGLLFVQANKAAYNYVSFADSVYGTLFAKVALFSYYIPDLLFMISAYLFTTKLLAYRQIQHGPILTYISKVFLRKLIRLYPIYISILLIYWFVTPALHCGPVWYVYENQVAQCNKSWWRSLLLIDNWFSQGNCYDILWFVQAEIQYSLFASIIMATYYKSKSLSLGIFYTIYAASLVLLFVLSASIVVTLDIMLENYTSFYFKSSYSHLPFYFTGMILAFLLSSQKKQSILNIFVKNKITKTISMFASLIITLLILYRPSVWSTSEHKLQIQLALSRLGLLCVFLFICILCVGLSRKDKQTCIHKYAYYVYPTLLMSQLVVQGAYWSVGSFMYIGASDMIDAALSNVLVSVSVGLLVGLLCDFKV